MSDPEIYDTTIRQLSELDRLHVKSIILDDLAAPNGAGLDMRDYWTGEDLASYSLKHAANSRDAEDTDA